MRIPHAAALTLIATALCVVPSTAEEHEKKINRSDLPPAVEKTVAAQTQGASIRGFNEAERIAGQSQQRQARQGRVHHQARQSGGI